MFTTIGKFTSVFIITLFVFSTTPAMAGDFTVANPDTVTTPQALDADNETGTVEAGATLDVAATAVDVSGTNALLDNSGAIVGTGLFANGVSLSGSSNSIVNSGDISGDFYGLQMFSGTGNNITNSGTIAGGAGGLYDAATGSTINNNGLLESFTGFGLYLTGSDTTANNNDTIYSTGTSLFEFGDDITINNNGTIESLNSDAMFSGGLNLILNNNGFIQSTNFSGLYVEGDYAEINNSGTIESINSYGIFGTGLNLTINNDGFIESTNGIGLFDEGNYTTINNRASISSLTAAGVTLQGLGTTLNNSGLIQSTNNKGIYLDYSDAATINNSGTIRSSNSYGIRDDGLSTTINNSGTIESSGDSAIYSYYSEGTTINNSGTVYSDGYNGLYFEETTDITVNNSGTILSSYAGLYADEVTNMTVNNSGTIISEGDYGMYVTWAYGNNTLNNSGLIQSADGYDGVLIENASGQVIINSGSIISPTDRGLVLDGTDNAEIKNSGFISGDTIAIDTTGSNDITLDLLSGSLIDGDIILGGGYNIVNVGANSSSIYDITAASEINFLNGAVGVIDGNTVHLVEASGDSHKAANISSTTSAIHGVLTSRLTRIAPVKLAQLASLELAPGMLYKERPAKAWGELFTLERTIDKDGTVLEYEQNISGFTGGYEFDNKTYRIGFVGGFSSSTAETDQQSIETDTDSIFLGTYGRFYLGKANLTASLVIGTEQHDNTRHIFSGGWKTATADYDSMFISPSVTVDSAYVVGDKLELRPSATLSYTMADFDGYKETGSTGSELTVKGQSLTAFSTQLQLALAHVSDKGEIELRVGSKTRSTDSDDISATLAGTSLKYAVTGEDNVSGAYFGLYGHYGVSESTNLTADIESTSFSGEDQLFAKVGLQVSF